ncbi:hypothetical protein BN871_BF_00470 [Paenibacillus sp. P22]|nr:hypothetical protein BN871_BF_00470 [Paenibacillus sp. P22]
MRREERGCDCFAGGSPVLNQYEKAPVFRALFSSYRADQRSGPPSLVVFSSGFFPQAAQVGQPGSGAEAAILEALELDGYVSVIAGRLDDADDLRHVDVPIADYRAAQVAAAGRAELALARIAVGRTQVEVLEVDDGSDRKIGLHGRDRVLVGAHEVAHIERRPEVGTVNRFDESLDAVAVLDEVAVVLDARRNAEACGIIGDFAAGRSKLIQGTVEVADRQIGVAGHVMPHEAGAERCGDVYLLLDPLDLGTIVLLRQALEISPDGIVGNSDSALRRPLHDLADKLGVAGKLIAERNDLHMLAAMLRGEVDDVENGHLTRSERLVKAVGAESELHGNVTSRPWAADS